MPQEFSEQELRRFLSVKATEETEYDFALLIFDARVPDDFFANALEYLIAHHRRRVLKGRLLTALQLLNELRKGMEADWQELRNLNRRFASE